VPTYQYACTACGEQLEVVQSFTDDALTECTACQGVLRKVYSAVGVVFKGSGFYKNDSRSTAGSNGKGSAESSGDSGSSDKASTSDKTGSGDKGKSDKGKSEKSSTSDSSAGSKATSSPASSSSTPAAKTA